MCIRDRHEAGAIEAGGHKILTIETTDGKLSASAVQALVDAHWADFAREHTVQPGLVYVSQPTECGTLYSKDELEALYKTCLLYTSKSDLYKISGHWDHYRDGMFVIGDADKAEEEEVFALRPMTCPFQFQAYLQKTRSYRDLPLRYNETSTLFRNEASGEMHGLIRLRQFTISEAHLIVRPDQIEAEFLGALDLAIFMLDALGLLEDVSYRFST